MLVLGQRMSQWWLEARPPCICFQAQFDMCEMVTWTTYGG